MKNKIIVYADLESSKTSAALTAFGFLTKTYMLSTLEFETLEDAERQSYESAKSSSTVIKKLRFYENGPDKITLIKKIDCK